MPYGIVANVKEPDRVARTGAKAWIVGGTGGEGWHRFKWRVMSRGGRPIIKWAPTMRFHNFRTKWIPDNIAASTHQLYLQGEREEMEAMAKELEAFAEDLRTAHPNRR